jgi:hypothetical protein
MLEVQLDTLAEEIVAGTAVIASDGSVNNDLDSFPSTQGWVVYGTSSKNRVSGHGTVNGGGQPMSSLRSEMGGLCGALSAVDVILQCRHPNEALSPLKITALIDNKALIHRIHRWNVISLSESLSPEYDLLQASRSLARKHSITLTPHHIKSHQDIDCNYDNLTWQAKLNCDCDEAAENVRKCSECERKAHRHYTLPPGHGATLVIDGKYITSYISKAIKEACYRKEMIEYVISNANWKSAEIYDLVDWEAKASAYKRIKKDACITITKLEFGMFATMHKQHRYHKEISPLCPHCNEHTETFDHVLKCSSVSSNTQST